MKEQFRMLVTGLFVSVVFTSVLFADDPASSGGVSGTFVRLAEQEFQEQEYLAVLIKPFESDDHVSLLVPRRREELGLAVRRLQEGQKVEIAYVTEGGHKWINRMEAERLLEGRRREGDREREETRILRVRPIQGGRERLDSRRPRVRPTERERRPEVVREKREVRRPWPRLEQMEKELKDVLAARLEQIARGLREVLAERLERMAKELREAVAAQLEQKERELQALRAENARLKKQLRELSLLRRERERESRERREDRERREGEERREGRERGEGEARRESRERGEREVRIERDEQKKADLPLLPDSMKGFRGVLVGTVLRRLDRGFVLKVQKVGEVWEDNRADNPQAAVGRELTITIRADEELGGRFLRTLRLLKMGDRVVVEAFHLEGNHLTFVEQLRKSD